MSFQLLLVSSPFVFDLFIQGRHLCLRICTSRAEERNLEDVSHTHAHHAKSNVMIHLLELIGWLCNFLKDADLGQTIRPIFSQIWRDQNCFSFYGFFQFYFFCFLCKLASSLLNWQAWIQHQQNTVAWWLSSFRNWRNFAQFKLVQLARDLTLSVKNLSLRTACWSCSCFVCYFFKIKH